MLISPQKELQELNAKLKTNDETWQQTCVAEVNNTTKQIRLATLKEVQKMAYGSGTNDSFRKWLEAEIARLQK
jgi:hypothetical protein